jgi:hypothetical protein
MGCEWDVELVCGALTGVDDPVYWC